MTEAAATTAEGFLHRLAVQLERGKHGVEPLLVRYEFTHAEALRCAALIRGALRLGLPGAR